MYREVYIRHKDADSNNGLANATAATASARAVVRGLGREGRDPDNDEETIDGKHNIRVGEPASAAESRSHDKVNPSRDGKEALETTKRQPKPESSCLFHKPPSALWDTKLTTAKVHPFVPRILEVSPRKTAISKHHARKAKMIWNE